MSITALPKLCAISKFDWSSAVCSQKDTLINYEIKINY